MRILSLSESGKLGNIASQQARQENLLLRISNYDLKPNICGYCAKSLKYQKRSHKFCNQSCGAKFNNEKRITKSKIQEVECSNCRTLLQRNKSTKMENSFCNNKNKCKMEFNRKIKFQTWKDGGKFSKTIRPYLLEKQDYRCFECKRKKWRNKPITLELEHRDGNSDNNAEENLCFLCPNCHAQTPTYKNKNKGNGRHSRRKRYKAGLSY